MFWKTVSGEYLGKRFAFVAFVVALISGCGSFAEKDSSTIMRVSSETGQVDCQLISILFSKSNNGFESIRFRPSYESKVTLWDSRYQLIEDSCQIWQSADKYSYVCNKAYPDQETAYKSYEQVQTYINQCLGQHPEGWKGWYEKQGILEGREEETQYLFEDQLRGILRKQSTSGFFEGSWSVYFWINSPSMLR